MHNDELKPVECCTKCRVKSPPSSHLSFEKTKEDFSSYAFYVFFTSDCKVVLFLLKRMSKKKKKKMYILFLNPTEMNFDGE